MFHKSDLLSVDTFSGLDKAGFADKYLKKTIHLTTQEENVKAAVIQQFNEIKKLQSEIEKAKTQYIQPYLTDKERRSAEGNLEKLTSRLKHQVVDFERIKNNIKHTKLYLNLKKEINFTEITSKINKEISKIDYFSLHTENDIGKYQSSLQIIKQEIKELSKQITKAKGKKVDALQAKLENNLHDLELLKQKVAGIATSQLIKDINKSKENILTTFTDDYKIKYQLSELNREINALQNLKEYPTYEALKRITDLRIEEAKLTNQDIKGLTTNKEDLIYLQIQFAEIKLLKHNLGLLTPEQLQKNKDKINNFINRIDSYVDRNKNVLSSTELTFFKSNKKDLKTDISNMDIAVARNNRFAQLEQTRIQLSATDKIKNFSNFMRFDELLERHKVRLEKELHKDPANNDLKADLAYIVDTLQKHRVNFYQSPELVKRLGQLEKSTKSETLKAKINKFRSESKTTPIGQLKQLALEIQKTLTPAQEQSRDDMIKRSIEAARVTLELIKPEIGTQGFVNKLKYLKEIVQLIDTIKNDVKGLITESDAVDTIEAYFEGHLDKERIEYWVNDLIDSIEEDLATIEKEIL